MILDLSRLKRKRCNGALVTPNWAFGHAGFGEQLVIQNVHWTFLGNCFTPRTRPMKTMAYERRRGLLVGEPFEIYSSSLKPKHVQLMRSTLKSLSTPTDSWVPSIGCVMSTNSG